MIESPKWNIDDASLHPATLPEHLEGLKISGKKLREKKLNPSLNLACDMTDVSVLRTAYRGA